jgi:hypothetical protein
MAARDSHIAGLRLAHSQEGATSSRLQVIGTRILFFDTARSFLDGFKLACVLILVK